MKWIKVYRRILFAAAAFAALTSAPPALAWGQERDQPLRRDPPPRESDAAPRRDRDAERPQRAEPEEAGRRGPQSADPARGIEWLRREIEPLERKYVEVRAHLMELTEAERERTAHLKREFDALRNEIRRHVAEAIEQRLGPPRDGDRRDPERGPRDQPARERILGEREGARPEPVSPEEEQWRNEIRNLERFAAELENGLRQDDVQGERRERMRLELEKLRERLEDTQRRLQPREPDRGEARQVAPRRDALPGRIVEDGRPAPEMRAPIRRPQPPGETPPNLRNNVPPPGQPPLVPVAHLQRELDQLRGQVSQLQEQVEDVRRLLQQLLDSTSGQRR